MISCHNITVLSVHNILNQLNTDSAERTKLMSGTIQIKVMWFKIALKNIR